MFELESTLHIAIGLLLVVSTSACSPPDTAKPILIELEPAAQLSAGLVHTCATLQNGNVGCWGKADRGEMGRQLPSSEASETLTSTSKATPLPILDKVATVGVGTEGSCAVIDGKTVLCWGDGRADQLGLKLGCESGYGACLFPPTRVSSLSDIVSVVSKKGSLFSGVDDEPAHAACALDASGLVRCWGAAGADELGRGMMLGDATTPEIVVDENGFTLRDITQISAGDLRICALDISGSVWCWGLTSSHGQPGGAAARRILLPQPAKAIATGIGHSCAVLEDGQIACWGRNINAECGVSSVKNSYCDCSEGDGCLADCVPDPVMVPGVSNAIGVAAGEYHSCAWTEGGDAFCWGSNQVLQLGNPTRMLESAPVQVTSISARIVEMALGRDHSCARTAEGQVYCWGGSGYGQAGL